MRQTSPSISTLAFLRGVILLGGGSGDRNIRIYDPGERVFVLLSFFHQLSVHPLLHVNRVAASRSVDWLRVVGNGGRECAAAAFRFFSAANKNVTQVAAALRAQHLDPVVVVAVGASGDGARVMRMHSREAAGGVLLGTQRKQRLRSTSRRFISFSS